MSVPLPAWRRERAAYPATVEIQTRYQDLDTLGHINNLAMGVILGEGRARFNFGMLSPQPDIAAGERWLIARVDTHYLAEAHFPDPVEVAVGVGRIGRTSWTIWSAAFQPGRCVALCDATVAVRDPHGAKMLPDALRAELERYRITAE